jgi:hypothetical protein
MLLNFALPEPKVVHNNSLQLPFSVPRPQIVSIANNTGPQLSLSDLNDTSSVTLMGFAGTLPSEGSTRIVPDGGGFYFQNLWADVRFYNDHLLFSDPSQVGGFYSYTNPYKYLLSVINVTGFCAGLFYEYENSTCNDSEYLDPGLNTKQTVQGYLTGTWNVSQTNFYWFYAAAGLEILCIAFVLPTYWGWWKLGRAVSFSPLEVAKAFEAPLLAEYNSNLAGGDLAKEACDRKFRYGATGEMEVDGHGVRQLQARKLAFADPEQVYRPLETCKFTN